MNDSNPPTRLRRALGSLLFASLLPLTVHAGHPLICHPYTIGEAKSLPGGTKDHFGLSPDYDRTHLIADTLALLTPDTPIIVRMETLRRAALYATNEMSAWRDERPYREADRTLALGLLQKLRERTQDATSEAQDLAWFDAGFYAETLRQAKLDPAFDGYTVLTDVAKRRPQDPAIQFALALASTSPKRGDHTAHLARAKAGAQSGSLLAANIQSHFQP